MPTNTVPFDLPYSSYSEYTRTDYGRFVHVNQKGVTVTAIPQLRVTNNNKDWRVKIHNEVDAGSAYLTREIYLRPPSYYVTNAGVPDSMGKHRFYGYGQYRPYVDPTSLLDANVQDAALRDLALKRLKQKLSNRSNQVNLLIPTVELREMRGTLRALALSATDLIRALIEIKRSKGASAFQFASHAWLNWSFAIQPTLNDIQEISQSIDSFLNAKGEKFTDYGASKKSWMTSRRDVTPCNFGTTGSQFYQLQHNLSYRYTCGYHPKVRSANNYGYGAHFGLEFGAMIPAFWELTPFSWLMDYFGTMGDYLEDVFVSDSVNTIYVNLGRKYEVSGQIFLNYVSTPITTQLSVDGRPGAFKMTQFDRSILSQLPTRSLRLKSVDEIGKSAVNKLLNLSSILVGSSRKHFKTL